MNAIHEVKDMKFERRTANVVVHFDKHEPYVDLHHNHDSDPDLPEPPDNFDLWNSFPEHFRERVANQFTTGIQNEYAGIRVRVQTEYAVARARQAEREARRNQERPVRRFRRGRP